MLTSSRLQRGLLVTLIGLLAAIAVVLVTLPPSGDSTPQRGPFLGPTLPNLRAADFRLPDQHGRPISLSRFRGRVVALTFIHSKCHDACPLMVNDIKGALDLMGPAASGVVALGVSVDPAEDTAKSRQRFLDRFGMDRRLHYLSSSAEALRRVWRAYAIQPIVGSSAQDAHSTYVLLIDRRGIERVGWPAAQLTPDGLAHDLVALERQS